MEKNWKAKLDGRRWSFNKICNSLLNEREIWDLDRFLYPVEEDLLPLCDLKNIEEAAKVVIDGINNKKSILIYSDVDLDGVSSTAIIYRYLSHFIQTSLDVYINDGKEHGLSLKAPCFEKKYDILIIVDAIQNDTILYQKLIDMGTDIVVLDHHDLSSSILSIQKKIHLVSSMNEYENPYLTAGLPPGHPE